MTRAGVSAGRVVVVVRVPWAQGENPGKSEAASPGLAGLRGCGLTCVEVVPRLLQQPGRWPEARAAALMPRLATVDALPVLVFFLLNTRFVPFALLCFAFPGKLEESLQGRWEEGVGLSCGLGFQGNRRGVD